MINEEWLANFPASEATFLRFYGSDHRPILTNVAFANVIKKQHFCFDKRLLTIPHFCNYVVAGWNSLSLRRNYTNLDQIRECRKAMATCCRHNNLNASKRIEELKDKLNKAMEASGSSRRRIAGLRNDLTLAYREEESYWKTKSSNNWLELGDRNTKFFHLVQKQGFKKIESIPSKMLLVRSIEGIKKSVCMRNRFFKIFIKILIIQSSNPYSMILFLQLLQI